MKEYLCFFQCLEGQDLFCQIFIREGTAPFPAEESMISRHGFREINSVAFEAGAAVMVDEDIAGHQVAISFQGCPETVVVVFEVAAAESFVQEAYPLHQFSAEEHAETDDPPKRDAPAAIFLTELRCIAVKGCCIRIGHVGNHLDAADTVGHGSDYAYIGSRVEAFQEA